MTNMEKLHSGKVYAPGDEEIMREQLKCLDMLYDFNTTRPAQMEKREEMLREMFAEIGEGTGTEPSGAGGLYQAQRGA